MAGYTVFRLERDSLGERQVPINAYYGIQTLRAKENFPISGILPLPSFIKATAIVKKAACAANLRLKLIDKKRAEAILKAADEVVSGRFDGQFIVDVYQAGAGTSHNMNANEVIANRAIELLGGAKGDYSLVHPNDHVNMSQSTNDTMPTALRVAALSETAQLSKALDRLQNALRKKEKEFDGIIKSGRTHLQDAVPVRLGQEFGSYASSVKASSERIINAAEKLNDIGLGGTAAGTGLNTHPRYRDIAVKELSRASGIKGLRKAPDYFSALNSMADFAALSGALKLLSIELIKIANDLRLLSSGPQTGLSEISLPPVQPGSSIMPGKVNPVMAEMLNMVSFQVIGNDLAIAMAAQAGQLELNVMLPVINYNLLKSIEILTSSANVFTDKCVTGIKANKKRCHELFERSAGLATILNTFIGYDRAAEIAKEAAVTGKTVKEIILDKGILSGLDLKRILEPKVITEPSDLNALKKGAGKRTKRSS